MQHVDIVYILIGGITMNDEFNEEEMSLDRYKILKEKTARELFYDSQCIIDINKAESKDEVDRALINARHRL